MDCSEDVKPVAFDVTGYGKKDVLLRDAECDSRKCEQTRSIRPTVRSREERVSRFARESQVTPPSPSQVTRVTKLVPTESASELVSLASKE